MICLRCWICLLILSQFCQAINFQVSFYWNDHPITLPSRKIVIPSGETITITRLDFLLSQPHLTLESGPTITASKWHAYIHGEKREILRFPHLTQDLISKLAFHLGPSIDINNTKPNQYPPKHALNPLHNNLHWSPQQGYIFLALEGHIPKEKTAFSYHYGNSENRLKLSFNGPFNPNGFYQLALHLDRLFPADFIIKEHSSTHSRPNDPALLHFREVLINAFTLTPINKETPLSHSSVKNTSRILGTPYSFSIPSNFPIPDLPTDFPLTNERVRLGKKLFFDPALSKTNSVSCASCHDPEKGFSDSATLSKGIHQKTTNRHSMPLLNLAWKKTAFRWDGEEPSLRAQILRPIEDPLEMGENLSTLPDKLSRKTSYPKLFKHAFGDSKITPERLAVSIEQYIFSLTSFDSKFDRAIKGLTELTEIEKRGFQLFMTENDPRLGLRGADCFHCHSGAFFTNHRFHNNGLPPKNNDLGLEHTTKHRTDRYRFSTPPLRNIAITAPYMHDGRFSTLEEVVNHYSSGIHYSSTLDPNITKHTGNGLNFSEDEKAALIAFLKTLTDSSFQLKQ